MRNYSLMGTEFQFGMMKKFWRWMVVMAIQQCKCMYCCSPAYLKIVEMVNFMLYVFYRNFLNDQKM